MLDVKIVLLGRMPYDLKIEKIRSWKSALFKIVDVDQLDLLIESDLPDWGYSKKILLERVTLCPPKEGFLLILTAVPIEHNYITHLLRDNTIILTFDQIVDTFRDQYIPIENLVIRMVYSFTMLYLNFLGIKERDREKIATLIHEEIRACIFDFGADKSQIIHSSLSPSICNHCRIRLSDISKTKIDIASSELKKLKRNSYDSIRVFLKVHPIWSIIISASVALLIGVIGNIVADFLWLPLSHWLKVT